MEKEMIILQDGSTLFASVEVTELSGGLGTASGTGIIYRSMVVCGWSNKP